MNERSRLRWAVSGAMPSVVGWTRKNRSPPGSVKSMNGPRSVGVQVGGNDSR